MSLVSSSITKMFLRQAAPTLTIARSMTSRITYNNPKNSSGALGLPYHYEMLQDVDRVKPFKEAVQRSCKDKIVLESGTGSGVWSITAARAGAKKVYAVEYDANIAEFATKNLTKAGFMGNKSGDNVAKLLRKDTTTVSLSEDLENNKAQVVIAENLSTWQVTEPQIQIMNHINTELAEPDAIRFPSIIHNSVELAYTEYSFLDAAVTLRTHYFEFTGIRGTKEELSDRVVFQTVDMSKPDNPTFVEDSVTIPVTRSGTINCVRLTSPLVVHDDITFEASDSLMPPVVVPLKEDLKVSKGDSVLVKIAYETNTDWHSFEIDASVVSSSK
jgi:predicted RNA methylase